MRFTTLELSGVVQVDIEPREDARGLFARSFCREEFSAHGLDPTISQCNISFNGKRGTLRGMHFQVSPHEEVKLVRVTRGAIFDVVIDLRRDQPTFRRWISVTLTADNRSALYIPSGFAHGFQTLTDDVEVFYQMNEAYHPELARGVRWNDLAFGVAWPILPPILSEQDATRPDFIG
jgi:dTDP-4-dehydrorhamnose 3,5-epimerase